MKRSSVSNRAKRTFLRSASLLLGVYAVMVLVELAVGQTLDATPQLDLRARVFFGVLRGLPYLLPLVLLIRCAMNHCRLRHYRAVVRSTAALGVLHMALQGAFIIAVMEISVL